MALDINVLHPYSVVLVTLDDKREFIVEMHAPTSTLSDLDSYAWVAGMANDASYQAVEFESRVYGFSKFATQEGIKQGLAAIPKRELLDPRQSASLRATWEPAPVSPGRGKFLAVVEEAKVISGPEYRMWTGMIVIAIAIVALLWGGFYAFRWIFRGFVG